MDKYGWYTEGDEIIGGTGDDLPELLTEAIAEFEAGEKLIAKNHGRTDEEVRQSVADFIRKLRVGDIRECCIDELIDEEDIADHQCDDSPPMGEADLWELIDVRVSDVVADGQASIIKDSTQFPVASESGTIDAAAVIEWARKNITFDPPHYCDGRNPFPFCLVDGKWIFGDKETENADIKAYVVYTTQPSPETGHEGWVWRAQGRMGEAESLKEAMSQAEAKLAQIAEKERREQAHGR